MKEIKRFFFGRKGVVKKLGRGEAD